jgi:peptide/nickel transport system substrate-binding protein
MEPKTKAPARLRRRAAAAAVAAASAAGLVAMLGLPAASTAHSSSRAVVHAASSTPLVMESSPESAITQTFNPYIQSAPVYGMGVDSLIYEPLMDFNLAKPSQAPYYMLATGYKWGPGGKSITFTIRQGVKFNDGSAMTPADVAFSFTMLQHNADVNSAGLQITGTSTSGNTVTVDFAVPEYTNLQAIGNTYVVPQSIWSSVGDPGTFTDANPVGTGPYKLGSFTVAGITLTANPSYWHGAPKISTVEFPVIASNPNVLSALNSNTLDWAGNFLSGLATTFVKPSPSTHHTWFAPVQTNTLEPNLNKWPTNQLAVRQAISLAIDRTAISTQGEAGLEPVVPNASGLVLPGFNSFLASSVAKYKLSPHAQTAAAIKVLKDAGYVIKHGFFFKGNQEVTIPVTDPSSYTDYAEDDSLVAAQLRKAHINAQFVGQTTGAWGADIASGNFILSMHWSQTSIAPYQLYDYWLNSSLISKSRAGNFEGLKNSAMDSALAKLAGQTTTAGQMKYLEPIEQYVATNLPVIPTVYGAAFDEYNSSHFSGWPSATNPYEIGQPGSPQNEIVVLHLTPTS